MSRLMVQGAVRWCSGQYGEYGFECARAAEQVAGHGLGCRDGNVLGVLAEGFVHCGCFGQVTGGGAGGVRVDVHDGLRVDVAVFEASRSARVAPSAAGSGAVMW